MKGAQRGSPASRPIPALRLIAGAETGQEGLVENGDGGGAGEDVGAARAIVGGERGWEPGSARWLAAMRARSRRRECRVSHRRRSAEKIAQPRRQRDAICRKGTRHAIGERMTWRGPSSVILPSMDCMRCSMRRERLVVGAAFLHIARPLYETGSIGCRAGDEREWPVRRMELRRDIAMRAFMREEEE